VETVEARASECEYSSEASSLTGGGAPAGQEYSRASVLFEIQMSCSERSGVQRLDFVRLPEQEVA
jgi:hypothetical protein